MFIELQVSPIVFTGTTKSFFVTLPNILPFTSTPLYRRPGMYFDSAAGEWKFAPVLISDEIQISPILSGTGIANSAIGSFYVNAAIPIISDA